MICEKIAIKDKIGLHLRTATLFAEIARRFDADIRVHCNGKMAEGKSVIGLLKLQAVNGEKLSIYIEGRDEEEAMKALLEFTATQI